MSEIDILVRSLTKLYIMINAMHLGWSIEIKDNEMILSKKNDELTSLDKNTYQLLGALLCDELVY